MMSFFSELGGRLAEKWLSLLVLPGLLLVSAAAAAAILGHASALDAAKLAAEADTWARALDARPPVAQALFLVGVLLACTGAGLAVRGLSVLTERLWLGAWPPFLAARFAARRERRWQRVQDAVGLARDHESADLGRLTAARNRIALAKPRRPTWMGDRIAAVEDRLHNQYQVDLQSWWPRLWLTLDDATRVELRAARAAVDTAATHATWSFGYAVVALFWWPAAPIAMGVWLTGWARGRGSVRTYADLIESAVDIHAGELARRLNTLPNSERFSREAGEEVTALFRKGT